MSDLVVIKEELSDRFDENMINFEATETVYIKQEEKDSAENELSIKTEVLDYEEISRENEFYGDCDLKYDPTLELNGDSIGDIKKLEIGDLKLYHEQVQKRIKCKEVLTCYNCKFKATRRVLIKHMKLHNKNTRKSKSFLTKQNNGTVNKCRYCNYSAMNDSVLKAHMNSHIGEKIFECGICDYSSKYKSSLKIHLMRHSNEAPFACPYCDYKAVKHSELKRHTITHTGDKPFKCEHCVYKTNRLYHLNVHNMRVHSNERPYSCSVCTYKATTGSDFKRHMCTHKLEKPYSCSQCDYVTSRLYDLKMHTNKHSGKYLHQCVHCGHRTNYLSSFKKHMNTHSKTVFK